MRRGETSRPRSWPVSGPSASSSACTRQWRAHRARRGPDHGPPRQCPPSIGTKFELDVLTAAILGGAAFTGGSGHPLGILFGVVTIGVLDAGIIFAGVPDFWQQIVKGAVLILALATDQFAIRRRARARPADAVEPTASSMTRRLPSSTPDPALRRPGRHPRRHASSSAATSRSRTARSPPSGRLVLGRGW